MQKYILLLIWTAFSTFGLSGCGTIFVSQKTTAEPLTEVHVQPEKRDFSEALEELDRSFINIKDLMLTDISNFDEEAETALKVKITTQVAALIKNSSDLMDQGCHEARLQLAKVYFHMWDSQNEQGFLFQDRDPTRLNLNKALELSLEASEHDVYGADLLASHIYFEQSYLPGMDSNENILNKLHLSESSMLKALEQLKPNPLNIPREDLESEIENLNQFIQRIQSDIQHYTGLENTLNL